MSEHPLSIDAIANYITGIADTIHKFACSSWSSRPMCHAQIPFLEHEVVPSQPKCALQNPVAPTEI